MKAVISHNGRLLLGTAAQPRLESGEVLVKVAACGISESDLACGDAAQYPGGVIPGHEISGEVVDAADEKYRYLVGKRVAVIPYLACQICLLCRSNRENLCKQAQYIGPRPNQDFGSVLPGGMAEYVKVWATHVLPLSEQVSDEEAACLDFLANGLSAALKPATVFAADCAVIGGKTAALAAVQFLKLLGAKRVFYIDSSEAKAKAAKQAGADETIPLDGNAVNTIREATQKGGCHYVFDACCTAHSQRTGIEILRTKGSMINIGGSGETVEYKLRDLNGERSICNVEKAVYKHYYTVLSMLEAGRCTAKPYLTRIYPLSEYEKGFEEQQGEAVKVLLKP